MVEHRQNPREPKTAPKEFFATEENPFHFVASGLDNVYLIGIRYFVNEDGEVTAEIPAVKQLMQVIARDLVEGTNSLTGSEIRFLRKRLGRKATEFAKELGIDPSHLSRIENGVNPMSEPLDKLARLVYAVSANDGELLKFVIDMVQTWLINYSTTDHPSKIVKKIDHNEWSDVLLAA